MPTPPALYPLISNHRLRRVLGQDDPLRDVRWIDPNARQAIEVGAGGGYYTHALAAHLAPVGQLTAIDPDASAVAALSSASGGRFSARHAEGSRLPFADASIDAALYGYSLEQFTDPHAGLAEAARVLRDGGQLVLFLWRPNALGTCRARRALRTLTTAGRFRLISAQRGWQNLRMELRNVACPASNQAGTAISVPR